MSKVPRSSSKPLPRPRTPASTTRPVELDTNKPTASRAHRPSSSPISSSKTPISARDVAKPSNDDLKSFIIDLNKLAKNVLPRIRAAVSEMIQVLCRIEVIWNECKPQLLAILDNLCKDRDESVSNAAKDVKTNGLRPVQTCVREKAEEFLLYANLTSLAQFGKKECDAKLKETQSPAYALPEGYTYAEVNPSNDLPEGFSYNPETKLIKIPELGLKAALFQGPDNKMVLAFAGTEAHVGKRMLRGWKANIEQGLLGGVPELYLKSMELVEHLKKQYGDQLVLAGYSQGGALAQFAGIAHNLKTYCLNSAGLGLGTREYLRNEEDIPIHERANTLVQHVNVVEEFLSWHAEPVTHAVSDEASRGYQLGKVYMVLPDTEDSSSIARHFGETVYTALSKEASKSPTQNQ